MKNILLAASIVLITFSTLCAQNAVLHESNNLIVKSLYSSLVVGEETAIFYEVQGKDLGEIVPKVVLNGELIDSLQSPISIAADKGPYLCLVFVFKKSGKATAIETVWIPVTPNHNTTFKISSSGNFFRNEGEADLMSDLMIKPIIGTNTRHCNSLRVIEGKASLISNGVAKKEISFFHGIIDMSQIRYVAREGDMLSIKVDRLGCYLSYDNMVDIDIPLADRYVKVKLTSAKTLPNFFIEKE